MEYVVLQLLYLSLHFIDFSQTREISRNPLTRYESNQILGNEPSSSSVTNYFVGTAIAHSIITYALPTEYKKYWLASTIGLEAIAVHHNYKLGLSIGF